MNVELLRKIVEQVEAEPRRFNMAVWYLNAVATVKGDEYYQELNDRSGSSTDLFEDKDQVPPCGAVGCMAGWACILDGKAFIKSTQHINGVELVTYAEPAYGWFRSARISLGLTEPEAMRLFYPNDSFVEETEAEDGGLPYWPEPYSSAYSENKTNPEGRAKILAARVEHFIATNGKE